MKVLQSSYAPRVKWGGGRYSHFFLYVDLDQASTVNPETIRNIRPGHIPKNN